MQHHWFHRRRYGIVPMPSSWEGWIITAVFFLCMLYVGIVIDSRSHSIADTLYGVLVPFLILSITFGGIFYLTSAKPEHSPKRKKPRR